MKKYIRLLYLIIIAVFVMSCSMAYRMPAYLRDNFTFKYTPEKKNLDLLININGYSTQINIMHRKVPKGFSRDNWENLIDTMYMNYLFFDDGIMIKNMRTSERTSDTVEMPKFMARMAVDTTNSLKLWGIWGIYVISGDTIKTQTINLQAL